MLKIWRNVSKTFRHDMSSVCLPVVLNGVCVLISILMACWPCSFVNIFYMIFFIFAEEWEEVPSRIWIMRKVWAFYSRNIHRLCCVLTELFSFISVCYFIPKIYGINNTNISYWFDVFYVSTIIPVQITLIYQSSEDYLITVLFRNVCPQYVNLW